MNAATANQSITGTLTIEGSLGIGTASVDQPLVVKRDQNDYTRILLDNTNPAGGTALRFSEGSSSRASLFYKNGGSYLALQNAKPGGKLRFQVTSSAGTTDFDAMVIDHNSNVGIGTTSPGHRLVVNGSAAKTTAGTGWIVISDARLKKNIQSLQGALGKLLKLRGVSFEWKEPEKHGNQTGKQIGMIAQEVEAVFPEWVSTNPNGFKDLTLSGFEALVVEAFREQNDETGKLQKKSEELEIRMRALERQMKTTNQKF
jgi:hypothetical protein